MCSCAEFVIVLCQPCLCNSCIKEKLTLISQLITRAQMEANRRTDRWTHAQTSKGGSACNELGFSFKFCQAAIDNTYDSYVRGGCCWRKLFLHNSCPSSSLVCSFLLFCAITRRLYIWYLFISCLLSHWVHTSAIWNIRRDASSLQCLDLWRFKKPLCRTVRVAQMVTVTQPLLLTRWDW